MPTVSLGSHVLSSTVVNLSSRRSHFSSFPFTRALDEDRESSRGKFLRRSQCASLDRVFSALDRKPREIVSRWDKNPLEVLRNGSEFYLDEQDIVTLLDPPNELIPISPSTYNPAAYLWKKIGDIPENRRQHLLTLLEPRLIERMWEMSGTRYMDPKLVKYNSSSLLSLGGSSVELEFWNCRTSGGSLSMAWIRGFKKVIFCGHNGSIYGRMFLGGRSLSKVTNLMCPLYFRVSQLKEVMPTEEPCDLAYEFENGLLDLNEYPTGFPKPERHPWPFCDQVVLYIRHVGPGVMVGQAWREGEVLDQVPRKLCGEILYVKEYQVQQQL